MQAAIRDITDPSVFRKGNHRPQQGVILRICGTSDNLLGSCAQPVFFPSRRKRKHRSNSGKATQKDPAAGSCMFPKEPRPVGLPKMGLRRDLIAAPGTDIGEDNCGRGLWGTTVPLLRQRQKLEIRNLTLKQDTNSSGGHSVLEAFARELGEIMGLAVFQKPRFHLPSGRNYTGCKTKQGCRKPSWSQSRVLAQAVRSRRFPVTTWRKHCGKTQAA